MDGEFSASGLQAIGPALQGVVDAGDLSGFVTLVWRGGQVVQVDTVGRRDIAGDKPMTRDTLFRIASMTKAVTSVAASLHQIGITGQYRLSEDRDGIRRHADRR